MNRAFSILGVREGASAEEIREAYEHRLRKYKSADYDDDPEYVKKKVKELKEAYAEATGSAHVGSPFAKADRKASEKSHHEYEMGRRKAAHAADDDYRESETQKYERKVNHRAERHKRAAKFESAPIIGGVQPSKTLKAKKSKAAVLIFLLAFLPSIVGLMSEVFDNDFNYIDVTDGFEYVDDYDQEVHYLALDINQAIDDESTYMYDEKWKDQGNDFIHKKADEFTKVYFSGRGISDFDELYQYLWENYEDYGYYFNEDEPMTEKLYTVAQIYGLPDKYTCQNLVNPYTDETISSDTEYLDYLIDYYNNNR